MPTYARAWQRQHTATLYVCHPGAVNAVTMGLCRGEVHGDLVCGRVLNDLLYCEWRYTYEKVLRYLCPQCRRTNSAAEEAHCRDPCLAKQRRESGRPARSQYSLCMDGAGWFSGKRKWKHGTTELMMQRRVKARYHSILAQEG